MDIECVRYTYKNFFEFFDNMSKLVSFFFGCVFHTTTSRHILSRSLRPIRCGDQFCNTFHVDCHLFHDNQLTNKHIDYSTNSKTKRHTEIERRHGTIIMTTKKSNNAMYRDEARKQHQICESFTRINWAFRFSILTAGFSMWFGLRFSLAHHHPLLPRGQWFAK